MEPSLTSAVALGQSVGGSLWPARVAYFFGATDSQSPSLWAKPLALIQNQDPNRFPDGTAPLATPAAGCEPARSNSRAPPPLTRRELSPQIPN